MASSSNNKSPIDLVSGYPSSDDDNHTSTPREPATAAAATNQGSFETQNGAVAFQLLVASAQRLIDASLTARHKRKREYNIRLCIDQFYFAWKVAFNVPLGPTYADTNASIVLAGLITGHNTNQTYFDPIKWSLALENDADSVSSGSDQDQHESGDPCCDDDDNDDDAAAEVNGGYCHIL